MNYNQCQKYGEKTFRNKITYFSFVLSFLVIVIHTSNISVYGLLEREDFFSGMIVWLEECIHNMIVGVCVPYFFLISGYLFFRTFEWNKILDKYKSRLFTVVFPYFLWCSIYYLYYCLISRIPGVSGYVNGGEAVGISITTWIDWLWNQSYYTLWFLKELIILIGLTPCIYLVMKNYKYIPVGVFVLLLIIMFKLRDTDIRVYDFSAYYLLGAYVGINHKDLPRIKSVKISNASRITLAGILCWYLGNVGYEIGRNTFLVMVLCVAIWWAFDGIDYDKPPKWWMGISFFIYCFHDLWLEGLEKIFLLVFGTQSVFALLDYIFMPIIVLIICIACAAILRRYFPFIWKVLMGGRGI